MTRDPKFDILFEPVAIGPVVARNRFYQVPHCNGMGYRAPAALAAMREVKAEGGWAVVCTEEAEIHPTSDLTPSIELRNWDDSDIPSLALITAAVHKHGSLAGIELVHNGGHAANRSTREAPLSPSSNSVDWIEPTQARRMTKSDIGDLRRWHREAIDRSIRAGFDIVYVYAGHMMTLIQQFLSPQTNTRTDEYGGSTENRSRLLREILEDARDEADGRAAVACRLCVDELRGSSGLVRGEVEEIVGTLAELPDLWDFQVGDWPNDSSTSRFREEGFQEKYVKGLKALTSKPVVGVGRFTSPDEMVRQITSGTLDLIGAARPSIADPFLPLKIEQGRNDDIRECIGCNICVSGDNLMAPIRCTQNPTMGEEWRRGWHPESIRVAHRADKVLVIGAGPAGLEAARSLGERRFEVVVVEASRELGGRVAREAALPGLATWRRVVDYRVAQIDKMPNVEIFRESPTTSAEALEYGFDHIAVATGAKWRSDGIGRSNARPIPIGDGAEILTPDDVMAGKRPHGRRVVLFDDDHYYMGGVIAELLAREQFEVEIVTPEPLVSAWTVNTLEQPRIHRRLLDLGVNIRVQHSVVAVGEGEVTITCEITGRRDRIGAGSVVMVTSRTPSDSIFDSLRAVIERQYRNGSLQTVRAIGDAWVPSTIASAVWWGHRYARELGEDPSNLVMRRE